RDLDQDGTARPYRVACVAAEERGQPAPVLEVKRLIEPEVRAEARELLGERAVEVPSRAAMASPGRSRMKRNVRSETPTSVGMAPTSRCARYRLTPRAATAP